VVQADFLQQTNHLPVAREMLRQAATLQPDLPFLQTCLAIDSYTQYNNADAEKEFRQAAALDAQDFRPPFYLAHIILRESGYTPQSTPRIIENLEKTVQLRPDFAPAWAFLSVAYRHQPDTKQRALDAAHKANNLEPAVMAYRVDVFDAQLALDREADARATWLTA
jgi:cytochrome c-type biogenesis protein CcmH/NrfG